ncbi:MAG: GNAT family N-acetyltransferase [Chloroflexi bacterium]|nr:GNAT family N-acetyltransferase [Chloroflexota bacterium]
MPTLRIATPADLPAIVAISNQAIAARNATADTTPFTLEVRLDWFTAHSADEYPIYVCGADDGQVLGWLSLSLYRGRSALARTAEVLYYVDYACHGNGIGSALMQVAITECPRLGKKVLVAILLKWNIPSIKLLEKFGFERWGFLPEVAEFSGDLCGHLYYGRKS